MESSSLINDLQGIREVVLTQTFDDQVPGWNGGALTRKITSWVKGWIRRMTMFD